MIMSKFMPLSQVQILATDIDENVIAQSKNRYLSGASLNEVPIEMKKKYFTKKESL